MQSVGGTNLLSLEVDLKGTSLVALHFLEKGLHFLTKEHHREDAILSAVIEKDVGKARCDDATETVVQ